MDYVFLKYYKAVVVTKLEHVRKLIKEDEYQHQLNLISLCEDLESIQKVSFIIDLLAFGYEWMKDNDQFKHLHSVSRKDLTKKLKELRDELGFEFEEEDD